MPSFSSATCQSKAVDHACPRDKMSHSSSDFIRPQSKVHSICFAYILIDRATQPVHCTSLWHHTSESATTFSVSRTVASASAPKDRRDRITPPPLSPAQQQQQQLWRQRSVRSICRRRRRVSSRLRSANIGQGGH